jgi:hypothetical protein
LFKDAVKAVTCRAKKDDEDEPQPRRRGETDKGFVAACRAILQRAAVKTGAAAARGSYAALRVAKAEPKAAPEVVAPATYARVGLSLSNTLDWQALWQDNANNDQWHDDNFSARQDQYFPQP